MTNRRYSDEEVAAIIAKAIEDEKPALTQPARDEGLSLAQLQEIGREAGIEPDAIARAATAIDAGGPTVARTVFGLPIAVERTIALNRRLTDDEWELLVVRLREAFDARGRVSAFGSFRQWTNGNLQALLEPTANGHRLRLRTIKGSSLMGFRAGSAMMLMSAVFTAIGVFGGHGGPSAAVIAPLFLFGATLIARAVLPLRSWARVRARQMDYVADGLLRG